MYKVYLNYNIMRVRMKVSFACYMKNFTLVEVWMNQIMNSYKFLTQTGQIYRNIHNHEEEMLFDAIPKLKIPDCLKKVI